MWLPLVMVALAACGNDDNRVGPSPVGPSSAVDSALVGTWVGPIEGSGGGMQASGTITLSLNGDGSMSAVSDTDPPFHPINSGTWSVSQNEFTARGPDVAGTLVQFVAPRSTTQLEGTWTAGSGSGTFAVTKQ